MYPLTVLNGHDALVPTMIEKSKSSTTEGFLNSSLNFLDRFTSVNIFWNLLVYSNPQLLFSFSIMLCSASSDTELPLTRRFARCLENCRAKTSFSEMYLKIIMESCMCSSRSLSSPLRELTLRSESMYCARSSAADLEGSAPPLA